MKISFYSNYMNHHQLPVSMELVKKLGEEYTFVATQPVSKERLKIGYRDESKLYPFVLTTYDSETNARRAFELALVSDAIIVGSASDDYMVERLKQGKLTFHFSERYFKQQWTIKNSLRFLFSALKHIRRFQNQPLYYLCASAYTAADVNKFANFSGRTYKWGYFTEVKKYDIDALFEKKRRNGRISILWCARLIELKHPEAAIEVACRLKADGYDFELNFIGDGPLREELSKLICEKQLTDHVHLLGSMPPEEVRIHMEEADIFLFTSDFNEGWGAVLNESMNSGCAVVASHAIGSVPFLIKHGENGLIYKNGKLDDLYAKTKRLVESAELRRELGERAYYTMEDLWNVEVAAERLLHLIEELQKYGQCDLYEDGPCSRAEILKNGWFRK